jgi:DNA damage-binding protein 1
LQTIGEFHLGEFVNRFAHGSLVMQTADSEAAKLPTVLFGTINGVIGVLASLPPDTYHLLEQLQVQSTVLKLDILKLYNSSK